MQRDRCSYGTDNSTCATRPEIAEAFLRRAQNELEERRIEWEQPFRMSENENEHNFETDKKPRVLLTRLLSNGLKRVRSESNERRATETADASTMGDSVDRKITVVVSSKSREMTKCVVGRAKIRGHIYFFICT